MMDLLDELQRMDEAPLVAPWEYTDEAFPLAELDRSLDAWRRSDERPGGGYQGWRRGYAAQDGPDGHAYIETGAHRPNPEARLGSERVHRAHCECGWVSSIGSERQSVAHWHDHAWPGWRDLPILDRFPGDRFNKPAMAKWREQIADVQPAAFQVENAPVLTRREPPGSRDVPNYSPFGGFDICHLTLEVPA